MPKAKAKKKTEKSVTGAQFYHERKSRTLLKRIQKELKGLSLKALRRV